MSVQLNERVAKSLSAESFVSGQALAEKYTVTRAAIWKVIKKLRRLGLEVVAERSQGYRLARSISWIDEGVLQQALADKASVVVAFETNSTNDAIKQHLSDLPYCFNIAEVQTAGRGRLGRNWLSPLGAGLYFSLKYYSQRGVTGLSGMSLMVGVSIAKTLRRFGVEAEVKWPNDIYVEGAKVGGVLIEANGQNQSGCEVIVGIGLNYCLSLSHQEGIAQNIRNVPLDEAVSRTDLLLSLCQQLIEDVACFEAEGFASVQPQWSQYDCLSGNFVDLIGAQIDSGLACGVGEDGSLLVQTKERIYSIISGEVSVRGIE